MISLQALVLDPVTLGSEDSMSITSNRTSRKKKPTVFQTEKKIEPIRERLRTSNLCEMIKKQIRRRARVASGFIDAYLKTWIKMRKLAQGDSVKFFYFHSHFKDYTTSFKRYSLGSLLISIELYLQTWCKSKASF